MKAFMIVMAIVVVAATVKYGPDLYVKGLREKDRLMTKMAEPFNERNADVSKLNKISTPTATGSNAAGGGVKPSTNEMLKQMKRQKKELRK